MKTQATEPETDIGQPRRISEIMNTQATEPEPDIGQPRRILEIMNTQATKPERDIVGLVTNLAIGMRSSPK